MDIQLLVYTVVLTLFAEKTHQRYALNITDISFRQTRILQRERDVDHYVDMQKGLLQG